MSELISGKEALIALANGEEVENWNGSVWWDVDETWQVGAFMADRKFRLKPRTITLNSIEVPAPFKPMHGEKYFYLNLQRECLYAAKEFNGNYSDNSAVELGAWRTEDEVKQVVAALRKIFNDS